MVTHSAPGPGVVEPEFGAGCCVPGRYFARDTSAQVKRPAIYHRGVLVGRGAETAMIDRLLAQARSGLSGVLVVRGEPGVGKSALLGHAVETAKLVRSTLEKAGVHLAPFAVG